MSLKGIIGRGMLGVGLLGLAAAGSAGINHIMGEQQHRAASESYDGCDFVSHSGWTAGTGALALSGLYLALGGLGPRREDEDNSPCSGLVNNPGRYFLDDHGPDSSVVFDPNDGLQTRFFDPREISPVGSRLQAPEVPAPVRVYTGTSLGLFEADSLRDSYHTEIPFPEE